MHPKCVGLSSAQIWALARSTTHQVGQQQMNEHFDRAREFARQNLAQCCAEIIEWLDKGVLRDAIQCHQARWLREIPYFRSVYRS